MWTIETNQMICFQPCRRRTRFLSIVARVVDLLLTFSFPPPPPPPIFTSLPSQ